MKVMCLLISHKWQQIRYPGADGHFLRCVRCGREREEPHFGTGGGMPGEA